MSLTHTSSGDAGTAADYGWQYDANNQVKQFTNAVSAYSNESIETLTYDADGQLTGATPSGTANSVNALSNSYDDNGNPTNTEDYLTGAGNRWSASQLRLRLVDASRFNPDTIMPSYYRNDGLVRVGGNFVGKPILSATEIEDIVAFLATLRD